MNGNIKSNSLRGKISAHGVIYGKDAYELAVMKGFDGTLEEWIDSLKGEQGEAAFIRYSAHADGSNFTEKWSEGQRYIGFATGQEAPTDKSGYTWVDICSKADLTEYAKTEEVKEYYGEPLPFEKGAGENSVQMIGSGSNLGAYSLQVGLNNTNTGKKSFMAGQGCTNSGENAIVSGNALECKTNGTIVTGQTNKSLAGSNQAIFGGFNTSNAENNLIAGGNNIGNHAFSFIAGQGHTTTRQYQSLLGSYSNPSANTLLAIGNGSSGSPNNAFEVFADGTAKLGDKNIASEEYVNNLFDEVKDITADIGENLVCGRDNFNTGDVGAVLGASNTNNGKYGVVCGDGNVNGADTESAFVGGHLNKNFCNGIREHSGKYNAIFGHDNCSTATDSLIVGNNNGVYDVDGIIEPIDCQNGIIGGRNNYSKHENVLVSGRYNRTTRDNQVLFGEYSNPTENILFAIGNGTGDTERSNAFEISQDGTAKIGDNTVATEEYVDAMVKGIGSVALTISPNAIRAFTLSYNSNTNQYKGAGMYLIYTGGSSASTLTFTKDDGSTYTRSTKLILFALAPYENNYSKLKATVVYYNGSLLSGYGYDRIDVNVGSSISIKAPSDAVTHVSHFNGAFGIPFPT